MRVNSGLLRAKRVRTSPGKKQVGTMPYGDQRRAASTVNRMFALLLAPYASQRPGGARVGSSTRSQPHASARLAVVISRARPRVMAGSRRWASRKPARWLTVIARRGDASAPALLARTWIVGCAVAIFSPTSRTWSRSAKSAR